MRVRQRRLLAICPPRPRAFLSSMPPPPHTHTPFPRISQRPPHGAVHFALLSVHADLVLTGASNAVTNPRLQVLDVPRAGSGPRLPQTRQGLPREARPRPRGIYFIAGNVLCSCRGLTGIIVTRMPH